MTTRILAPNDPALAAYQDALAAPGAPDATVDIVPFAEYRAQLNAALDAPTSAYHVVFVPGHLWVPELAAAGKLAPLATPPDADLVPLVAEECTYGGKTYMVPLFTDGHILFYDPARVALPADTTVVRPSALPGLAASATPPDGGHAIALKAHPAEIFLDWLPYLLDAGGRVLGDDGHPAFNTEAGISALAAYVTMTAVAPETTHRYSNEEVAEALQTGTVAMAVTWGGQAAPVFNAPGSVAATTYRVVPLTTPWNATWGAAIPANIPAAAQQEAAAVLAALNGPAMDARVIEHAGSPVYASSYTADAIATYPWLTAQQHMLANAVILPKLPQIGAVLGTLYDQVYLAFRRKVTPAAALSAAEAAVREALEG